MLNQTEMVWRKQEILQNNRSSERERGVKFTRQFSFGRVEEFSNALSIGFLSILSVNVYFNFRILRGRLLHINHFQFLPPPIPENSMSILARES